MSYENNLIFVASTVTNEAKKEENTDTTKPVSLDFKLDPSQVGIPNDPLTHDSLNGLINLALYWGVGLSVIMIIVGGIFYASSASDETKVRRAKATILFSVIGLVVMLLALVIVNFVIQTASGE